MNSDPRSCSLDVDLGRIKVTSPERRQRIGNVFDRIADRYDLMSFRTHSRRRFVLKTGSFSLLRLAGVALLAVVAISTASAQDVWREPVTGMDFVRLPGGCFEMGDTFGDGETNERPVHKVCMKPYWIGRHEVTQAQWTRLMDYNMSVFNASPSHPVDSVNQADIAAFVGKLGGHHPDKVFRVPTEAEWEYACRAGGQRERFGGEPPPDGANTAEYADRHGEGSVAAGSFAPNALGIHDMSGNLWEWVSDVYAADAYLHHEAQDPHYQSSGPSRLLRGGAWSHDAAFARCTKRHMHCRPTARFDFVGFRLVLEEGAVTAARSSRNPKPDNTW